ncbi:MAG: hypothetical protein JXP73_05730 [Deltaproteobacteria bacterium]|nr:hypothetical protein [Deltaproteobacteria bacterium]
MANASSRQRLVTFAALFWAGSLGSACRSPVPPRPGTPVASSSAAKATPVAVMAERADAGGNEPSPDEPPLVVKLCAGRPGCRFAKGAVARSPFASGRPTLFLELTLARDEQKGCTPRELWMIPPAAPDRPHVAKRACGDEPILSRVPPPAAKAAARRVTTGPGWVSVGEDFQPMLAFSPNGLWFASFVRGGILLGDSQTGKPLALAPFDYEKAAALAFHPANRYLVAIVDFSLLLLAVDREGDAVRLRRAGVLPEPVEGLGLLPPAFDDSGRFMAVAAYRTATLYDWRKRRPLCRIDPGFESGSWVMGFHRDRLYLVEPTTEPCNCDDYRGSRAAAASFRLGGRQVERLWLPGDVALPLHLRQGMVASRVGLWDARTGQPRLRFRLPPDTRLLHAYRLRTQAASVGTLVNADLVHKDDFSQDLVVLGDDGTLRNMGKLPEAPGAIAVRPQDDLLMFWGTDQERVLFSIRLADGHVERVPYQEKLCVDGGQVVPDPRCPADGAELESPALQHSPGSDPELRMYSAPQVGERPQEGDLRLDSEGGAWPLRE